MKKWSPYRSSLKAVTVVPVGPRDPCPCGSAKMFKNCCLPSLERPDFDPDDETDQREALALCVLSAITASRLSQAELLCWSLKLRWPHEIDWCCSYAVLYERRGEATRAAEHWRRAVALAQSLAGADPRALQILAARADRLDPPSPAADP